MSVEQSIIECLESVEKQNRWMKRIGVAAIMIAASLLLRGQRQPVNRTVEANEFILRDSNGIVRAKCRSMSYFLCRKAHGSNAYCTP